MLTIACGAPANIDQLRDCSRAHKLGSQSLVPAASRRTSAAAATCFISSRSCARNFNTSGDDNLQLVCVASVGQSAQTTNGSHSFSLVRIASELGNWDDCRDHIGAGEIEGIPCICPFPSVCDGLQGHLLHWSWSFLNQLHQQLSSTPPLPASDGRYCSIHRPTEPWLRQSTSKPRVLGSPGQAAKRTDQVVSVYKLFQLICM